MLQVKLLFSNILLWLSLLPATIRYFIAFLFPLRAQKKVLDAILEKTNISRELFTVHQLTNYNDYEADIQTLVKTGVHPTYREEVRLLCPTSGTGGKNKLIPYTKSLKAAFQNGLYPWLFCMYLRFPALFVSRQYWSLTPVSKTKIYDASSKVHIGFEDDEEYVGALQHFITKLVWVDTKGIIADNPDVLTFLARLGIYLRDETHLGLVSAWSPSLISLLIQKHAAVFPKNTVLSIWAHGYSKREAHTIAKTTGAQLQPKGLFSTEACVTIPIGTQTFLLCYNSHYFEFKDLETGKLETATTLAVGHEYEVILTTQSGFVRYASGDVVRVAKLVFGRPSCEFVRRIGVSDLFGEKLDEKTIVQSVTLLLGESQAEKLFWFLSPTVDKDGLVSYTLFIESDLSDASLGKTLDRQLRTSYHYDYCRELGQLGEVRVFVIKDLAPEARFMEVSAQESGARIGDVKMKRLSTKTDWHENFSGHFI